MTKSGIPHGAWVLVGDGRKALVLRNEGDETYPNLQALGVLKDGDNPATAKLGADKPGRAVEHVTGRRSALEQTDWHDIAEHRFADHVAAVLNARDAEVSSLIVVAPPRTLAELRRTFSPALQRKIIREIDKDLTKLPAYEIEGVLAKDN